MRHIRAKTALLAGALALPLLSGRPLWANAPNLLTYQGRLQESGSPVSGARSVEIALCNAFTGPTCFSSGVQGVSVSNGLFRSTFTVPGSVDLTAGNWYLEISVGPAGGGVTILSPREQLTSSPYAVHAGSAALVMAANVGPGLLGSSVVLPAAQVGAGTLGTGVVFAGALGSGVTIPAAQITAGTLGSGVAITFIGTLGSGSVVPPATIGAGFIGSGVVFDGSLGSAIVIPPAQIGAGTIGSGVSITFVGTLGSGVIVPAAQIGSGTLGSGVTLGPGTVGSGVIVPADQVGAGTLGSGVAITFIGTLGSGVTIPATQITGATLTVTASGLVGISTAAPISYADTKLNVNGQILAFPGNNASPSYSFAGTGNVGMYLVGGNGIGFTSGSEKMRIDGTSGNVGIGTTSPGTVLDVNGAATLRAAETVTSSVTVKGNVGTALDISGVTDGSTGPDIKMNSTDGSGYAIKMFMSGTRKALFIVNTGETYFDSDQGNNLHLRADSGSNTGILFLESGGVARMTIKPTGNVGIGTAGPAAKLHLSSGTLLIDGNASSGLKIFGSTFAVNSDGNVGIGQASPQLRLDVLSPVPGAASEVARFAVATGPGMMDLRSNDSSEQDTQLRFDSFSASQGGLRNMGGVGFVAGGHMSFTTTNDGALSASEYLRIKATGEVGVGTASPVVALDVKSQGELGLGSFTQAQINAKTPGRVGTLIFNSTSNVVCVSTGTTVMGYSLVSSVASCQ